MSKLFNFTENHFLSLIKQKIPLDCIFLLELIILEENIDSEEYLPFIQRLQRKGYIDGKQKPTEYGAALYKSLFEEVVAVKPKTIVQKNDLFEKWWETYPATNDFTINGRHFQGSQTKRIQKDECRKMFAIMCNSFKGEDIIAATAYHINNAKEVSFKRKDNQLTYVTNSLRYLREKYFEPFISKVKEKEQIAASKEFEI